MRKSIFSNLGVCLPFPEYLFVGFLTPLTFVVDKGLRGKEQPASVKKKWANLVERQGQLKKFCICLLIAIYYALVT